VIGDAVLSHDVSAARGRFAGWQAARQRRNQLLPHRARRFDETISLLDSLKLRAQGSLTEPPGVSAGERGDSRSWARLHSGAWRRTATIDEEAAGSKATVEPFGARHAALAVLGFLGVVAFNSGIAVTSATIQMEAAPAVNALAGGHLRRAVDLQANIPPFSIVSSSADRGLSRTAWAVVRS